MRLFRIPRIHSTVLTKGRWAFAPARQAFCLRRPELRLSHAVNSAPAVEDVPSWQGSVLTVPTIVPGQRSIYSDLLLSHALEIYRDPGFPLSDTALAEAQFLAGLREDQLSVVTAQLVLRISDKLDRSIRDLLPDDTKWNAILDQLAERGHTEADVNRWAWIMLAEDADARVYRFFSDTRHKPLFVLFYLLNESPFFTDPECLLALIDYCEQWYVRPRGDADPAAGPVGADLGMTPTLFRKVLRQLGFHASRLQPRGMREIADLAVAYIRDIPLGRSVRDKVYKLQCEVFNTALQSVATPARESPYDNMIHSWKAVTELLSLSSSMQPPLIIERESYRAIRQVLLGLPKNEAERETASALSTSWPPYRLLRDGMEEKAGTHEYLSRTVKAGFMMQEAGYAKEDIDLTVDILGGMAPDGSPTVQTRANYPRSIRHPQAIWAALIRTTRNAHEAWAVFLNPPNPMIAGKEVYWEMLTKLVARDANPNHNNLPGDGREVFPYHDANFSDYEKSRLRPPSVKRLTWWMSKAGIPLSVRSLAHLIRMAPSLWDAMAYIDNTSNMDGGLKKDLRWALDNFGDLSDDALSRPPRELLYAFIDLLCRLHASRPKGRPQGVSERRQHKYVQYAIRLAQMGWMPPKTSGRAAWENIMACIARPRLVVGLLHSRLKVNDTQALVLATEVMGKAEAHCGLNVNMLISYALCIQKSVASRLEAWADDGHAATPTDREFLSLYEPLDAPLAVPEAPVFRRETADKTRWTKPTDSFSREGSKFHLQNPFRTVLAATDRLKASWRVLAQRGPAHDPKPNSAVAAAHIHQYMRSLAFVGEYEEMVLLLWWTIREWLPVAEEDAILRETLRLQRTLCAFRAFAEPMVPEETVAALREKIESLPRYSDDGGVVVQWPTDLEVDEYIPCDETNQFLQDALVGRAAGSQQQQQEDF